MYFGNAVIGSLENGSMVVLPEIPSIGFDRLCAEVLILQWLSRGCRTGLSILF